jgi:chlorobactene glucosyltransferase
VFQVVAVYWWFLAFYLIYCAWDNARLFVKPSEPDPRRKKWPLVSVLIPARNEELRIRPCLESLLKQDYPSFEILVLDDRSTDGTFNLVKGLAKHNSRLKIIKGRELPAGWVGKPWACFQLSKKAKGNWLFFTDADTWHGPEMLKRTVQMAEEKEGDVLTLFTRQITKTWMEALVIPVMAYTLLAFLPVRWSLRKNSFFNRFAGVSGQFVFIQRKVYRTFGGHQAVKNEIVEDLNFGKQVVQHGFRLVYGDGSDFSFCRMYTNAGEVWHGFSKNFFPAVAFSLLYFLNAQIVLVLDGVLPFVAMAMGPGFALFWPGAALALVSLGVRGLQAVQYGFHKGSVFFHPLGCLLFALIGFNSLRWYWWRGHGHWKGRTLKRGG